MKHRAYAFFHNSVLRRAACLSWVILSLILAQFIPIAHAADVTLSWDPNTETDLAGYKIYYGFQTGNYTYTIDVGNQITYTVSGIAEGQPVHFVATAYDVNGNESDYSKEVVFEAVNQIPTADAGPDQTADEGAFVTLSGINSSDPEGRALSYFWEQTGGSVNVDITHPTSAQASFTAPNPGADDRSLVFRLTVTDDLGLTAEDYCVVNVSRDNMPPTANAGADQTVAEGNEVALDGAASSDPDDGISNVYWAQISGPEVTIEDPTQLVTSFIAPDLASEGASLIFELAVQDLGGLITRDTCVVNVTRLNAAPTADAGQDQTVNGGDSVRLDGSRSADPDDGIAAVRWTQIGGAAVSFSDPTALTPTFTAPAVTQSQTLTFQLTVTDTAGLASQDNCVVIVNPTTSGDSPTLKITASKLEGSVRVFRRQPVSINISVDPIDLGTQSVDLWLIADAPDGRFYYVEGFGWYDQPTPYAQISVANGISTKAFSNKLPVGNYTFTFAIDNNSDGNLDGTWTDTVSVEVW